MPSETTMYIGEVAACTGLTERTLRFYEEQGLIAPRRTASGRRVYDAGDLSRLHHIALLKGASFSLTQIKSLLDRPYFDASELIETQIAALEHERAALDRAIACLKRTSADLAAGTPIDCGTLCELILLGERQMQNQAWLDYFDKHCTSDEQERWKSAKRKAAGADWEGYQRRWEDWAQRVLKALPLDPASDAAKQFLDEWRALLTPFVDALTDDMKAEAADFLRRAKQEGVASPLEAQVAEFIEAARRAHGDA